MADKTPHDFEPCLLVAMPQMQDPNFSQTVSLLSEFNEKGAVSLILNRPLQISLYDVLSPDFRKQFELDPKVAKTLKKNPVYWGGPVDIQQGLILHTCPDFQEDSVPVQDDVFITGSIHILKELLKRKANGESDLFFRFLLGYAGWEAQQLEQEMSESCWLTAKLEKYVFQTKPDDLWKEVVKNMGVEISQLTSVSQENFH